jgi:hypothetical protein
MDPLDRRRFLESLAKSAVGGALLGVGHTVVRGQSPPAAPTNVRVGSAGSASSTRRLLTPSDMTYRGSWRFPTSGPDNWTYSGPCLTCRYVNGVRTWFSISYDGTLVELAEPTGFGTSIDLAPELTPIRRWGPSTWWRLDQWPTGGEAGAVIGDLWWDEARQVVWYTAYPWYGSNTLFLGCAALHNDGTATRYGMWTYAGNNPKEVCQWIVPIPVSAQGDVGGRTMALGGACMNIDGPANHGPGLYAVVFPTLGQTTPVPNGVPLAGYAKDLPGAPAWPKYYCKREADYAVITQSDMFANPVGTEGYWLGELDGVSGYFWIETTSVQGVVVMGRRAHGNVWYGGCPSPAGDWDPSGSDKGSHAAGYDAAMWVFDPADLRACARGTIAPWNVRYKNWYDWHKLWPAVPRTYSTDHKDAVIYDSGGSPNYGQYDPIRRQIVWALARSYGNNIPTVHIWEVPA